MLEMKGAANRSACIVEDSDIINDSSNKPFSSISKRQISHIIDITLPYMKFISNLFDMTKHLVVLLTMDQTILKVYCGNLSLENYKPEIVTNLLREQMDNDGVFERLHRGEPIFFCERELSSLLIPIRNSYGELLTCLAVITNGEIDHSVLKFALATISSIEYTLDKTDIIHKEKGDILEDIIFKSIYELRNPLSVIQAFIQLGKINYHVQNKKHYYQKIEQQLDSLLAMLENIKKLTTGEEFRSLLPGKIIEGLIDKTRAIFLTKKIELIIENNNRTKCFIKKNLFISAVNQILTNAVEAIQYDGQIVIEIRDLPDRVCICISNNGKEISKDIASRIFNPFVSSKKKHPGLGLYMVEQIIKKIHQGDVSLKTMGDKETAFYIELPLN